MEIKIIVCSIVTVENKNNSFYADGRTSAYYKNLKELTLMAFHNRMSALRTFTHFSTHFSTKQQSLTCLYYVSLSDNKCILVTEIRKVRLTVQDSCTTGNTLQGNLKLN